MRFLGATLIGAAVVFALDLVASMIFEGGSQSLFRALVEAAALAGLFGIAFHYLHGAVAWVFRWYRLDQPEGRHLFDRTPALDQLREESSL